MGLTSFPLLGRSEDGRTIIPDYDKIRKHISPRGDSHLITKIRSGRRGVIPGVSVDHIPSEPAALLRAGAAWGSRGLPSIAVLVPVNIPSTQAAASASVSNSSE